jgi:cobalamin-dependent methionine synthase I
MHKNKIARFQAGKSGGVEMVISLAPTIIATAEELAERLQTSREEVLTNYFAEMLESIPDALREFIPAGWVFPTREAADGFIEREALDPRQYIAEQYEGGGWGVFDTAEYIVTDRHGAAIFA